MHQLMEQKVDRTQLYEFYEEKANKNHVENIISIQSDLIQSQYIQADQ